MLNETNHRSMRLRQMNHIGQINSSQSHLLTLWHHDIPSAARERAATRKRRSLTPEVYTSTPVKNAAREKAARDAARGRGRQPVAVGHGGHGRHPTEAGRWGRGRQLVAGHRGRQPAAASRGRQPVAAGCGGHDRTRSHWPGQNRGEWRMFLSSVRHSAWRPTVQRLDPVQYVRRLGPWGLYRIWWWILYMRHVLDTLKARDLGPSPKYCCPCCCYYCCIFLLIWFIT